MGLFWIAKKELSNETEGQQDKGSGHPAMVGPGGMVDGRGRKVGRKEHDHRGEGESQPEGGFGFIRDGQEKQTQKYGEDNRNKSSD